jgi:hypothetical protein
VIARVDAHGAIDGAADGAIAGPIDGPVDGVHGAAFLGRSRPARARTVHADLLFLRGHRARVARLPVGEPEGLMPNLLSVPNHTGWV